MEPDVAVGVDCACAVDKGVDGPLVAVKIDAGSTALEDVGDIEAPWGCSPNAERS